MVVELYSIYQSWAGESSRDNPTSPPTVWVELGQTITLSITATDQAEQGNHDFPEDIFGKRHIESFYFSSAFQTRIKMSNK